jgi:hypothetical protein
MDTEGRLYHIFWTVRLCHYNNRSGAEKQIAIIEVMPHF